MKLNSSFPEMTLNMKSGIEKILPQPVGGEPSFQNYFITSFDRTKNADSEQISSSFKRKFLRILKSLKTGESEVTTGSLTTFQMSFLIQTLKWCNVLTRRNCF